MSKISDRLIIIVNNEGVSVRSLESKIGCSNGVLSKSMTGGSEISGKWLSKIIETFPSYSARWIMTGEGSMLAQLKEGNSLVPYQKSLTNLGTGEDSMCELCQVKDKLIQSQEREIELLSKLVNHLEEKILSK